MAIDIRNDAISSIPLFTQNQVLRADDLNKMVQAVLDQLRESRRFNVGLGIVEGFTVAWRPAVPANDADSVSAEAAALVVSSGFGVSSDGYSFDLPDCAFTYYRAVGASLEKYRPLAGRCEEYDSLMDTLANSGFELGAPALGEREGWTSISELRGSKSFRADEPYCLLYLYREEEQSQALCFNECEARGAEQAGRYHALLLPEAIYSDIFTQYRNEEEPPAQSFSLDPVPALAAFGAEDGEVKLCQIEGWTDLYVGYQQACSNVAVELATAIANAWAQIGQKTGVERDGFYEGLTDQLSNLTQSIYPAEPPADYTDIQYLHAYFHELILAYSALYSVLQGQAISLGNSTNSEVTSIRCRFPGHLGIRGLLFPSEGDFTAELLPAQQDRCRSSRILPDGGLERQTLKALAESHLARLLALLPGDNLLLSTWQREGLTNIRITPDVRHFPFLQGRAVPFYYREGVTEVWRVGKQPNLRSYRYVANDPEHPLALADDQWDFYRIEGHLGRAGALARIEELRNCLNLAFDVVAVELSDRPAGSDAPAVPGTDFENWYKNARYDLLLVLEELQAANVTDADVQGNLPDFFSSLLSFLRQTSSLADVRDWESLPASDCDPLPEELTSAMLDAVEAHYQNFLAWLGEQESNPAQALALDPDWARCVKDAAMRQRLLMEANWRGDRFAGFAREHPGLMHKGGVPAGGTLVLVYKEDFDQNRLIELLQQLDLSDDNTDGIPLNELDNETLVGIAERNKVRTEDFFTQTVVADFCLPYLCCGAAMPTIAKAPTITLPLTAGGYTEGCGESASLVAFVSEIGGLLSVDLAGRNLLSTNPTNALANYALSGLTAEDFSEGPVATTLRYTKEGREAIPVALLLEGPSLLAIIECGFDRVAENDARGSLLVFTFQLGGAAGNAVTVQGEVVDFSYNPDTMTGELSLTPEQFTRAEGRFRLVGQEAKCPSEAVLDLCDKLQLEEIVEVLDSCSLDDNEEISCNNPVVLSSETAIPTYEIVESTTELSGFVELIPKFPGGQMQVVAVETLPDELDMNSILLTVPWVNERGNEFLRYFLVLDFRVLSSDAFGSIRERFIAAGVDSALLTEGSSVEGSLSSVSLSYQLAGCPPTDHEFKVAYFLPIVIFSDPVTLDVLRERTASRAEDLAKIEQDAEVNPASEVAGSARAYVAGTVDAPSSLGALRLTVNQLSSRLEESPDDQAYVRKTGELIAITFLDRLAVDGNDSLTEVEEQMIVELRNEIDKLDVNPNTVFRKWKGRSGLGDFVDNDRLTAIGKKLRE